MIYQNFQKNIFYNVDIFVKSNKIEKNSNNSKSATALLKSNKNHLQNTKSDFKFIYPQFSDVGNHVTLISIYFIFGEK